MMRGGFGGGMYGGGMIAPAYGGMIAPAYGGVIAPAYGGVVPMYGGIRRFKEEITDVDR